MSKNNNKETTNNSKTYIIFAVVLVACGLLGGVSVAVIQYLKFMCGDYDIQGLYDILAAATPILYVLIELALFVLCAVHFSKTKKLVKEWDGEDEDAIEVIESRLNKPILVSNFGMILSMMMFGVCVYYDKLATNEADWRFITVFVTFILSFVYIMGYQAAVVNLEKKLNPEKRGNVFDFNFARKWENSMDEAEKKIQYMAGYKAFKAGSLTCTILWLVAIIGTMTLDMGISSLIMVCIIWFVLTTTYTVQVMKLEKRKK